MKKGFMTLGLAAALTTAQVEPAHAINKEWSAVAGFVGGLLVANAAHNSPRYERRVIHHQPVQHYTHVEYREPVRSGYYTWETTRKWVPGYWVYEDTGCGVRKVWNPGYHKTYRHRVWVDTGCRSGW